MAPCPSTNPHTAWTESSAAAGWSTSRVPDVDSDGRSDLVIGAPGWGGGSSPSHVYLLGQTTIGATTLARIDDTGANNKLGYSVCGFSDISGDGVPDYATGAPFGEYVIWADGADRTVGGVVPSHPGIVDMANGPSYTHYFGKSVAELSGGQLLESSRYHVGGVGTSAIWFVPGAYGVEPKLEIEAAYHWRNSDPAIRNVGDLVGNDGIDDFLMATDDDMESRGRVSLVSGAIPTTGVALLADIEECHFDGPAVETVLGDLVSWGQHPLSTAGDFNGDGIMDFVFTAVRPHGWTGAAYFYDGASREMLWELPRPAGVTKICGMVENVGDVDGDGEDDVAVSAEQTGAVGTVFFYSPTRQEYIGALTGDSADDLFGRSVLSLGDLNADGMADFGIGAPAADYSSEDAGSFFVYLSIPEPATTSLLAVAFMLVLGFSAARKGHRAIR